MANYPKVTDSCGCVFCDLGLATKEVEDDHPEAGLHFHQITSLATDGLRHTKFIPCPVKNK